jgi:hypothetical protein
MPPRAARAPQGKNTGHTRSKLLKSLRDVYEDSCKERQVHANSSVLSLLPDRQGVALATDTLDVSRNYLGDKGIVPLLHVVERSPALRRLVAAENGLRNNAVKSICAVAAKHPNLREIDLSGNYISEGAAAAILRLLDDNRRLVAVNIEDTKIDVETRVRIKDLLERNQLLSRPAESTV